MKRKSLLLSLFALLPLCAAWADVEINETNFPDENFRNYLLDQSYGSDSVLTNEEIQNVTYISVYRKDIQSLQGIEFFTALEDLSCAYNQLSSLDVSKNTALTYLRCYSNQFDSLDVSKNTALTRLECYENQLTSLNVSGCTELTSLFCYSNQLDSLDLSNNRALTRLDCYSNQLDSLDVSGCTALTRLECYENQLTSLDVTGCTALTRLYCYENQLTSLDVTGCTALTELYCYQNQIQGEAMDAFLECLPSGSNAEMYIIYDENEQNEMTVTQVTAAKAKGWIPYYYSDEKKWVEYTGSDPSDINAVILDTDDANAWYDLSGRRINGKPTEKGIYVKDGKKILVK